MGYHHLAFASRDMQATHHFYADVPELEAPPTPVSHSAAEHRAATGERVTAAAG